MKVLQTEEFFQVIINFNKQLLLIMSTYTNWSTNEVIHWLKNDLDLPCIDPNTWKNMGINGRMLTSLLDEEGHQILRDELRIMSKLHQKVILNAIKHLECNYQFKVVLGHRKANILVRKYMIVSELLEALSFAFQLKSHEQIIGFRDQKTAMIIPPSIICADPD